MDVNFCKRFFGGFMHFCFKKYFLFCLMLILVVLLVGPISAHASAISVEKIGKIKDTQVYHLINQQEIATSVKYSGLGGSVAAGGGGFILTVLASLAEAEMHESSAQAAFTKLGPVREKLAAIDFRKLFNDRLDAALTKELVSKNYFDIKGVAHLNEDKTSLLKKLYKPGSGTILMLETKYYFIESYQALVVDTNIDLILEPSVVVKDEHFDDGEEEQDDTIFPIYRGKARYQSKMLTPGENYLAYWARDQNVLNELMESLEILPKLVVRNLLDSVKDINPLKSDYWKMVDERFVPGFMSAELLGANNERDLVYQRLLGRDTYVSVSKQDRHVDEPEDKDEDEF